MIFSKGFPLEFCSFSYQSLSVFTCVLYSRPSLRACKHFEYGKLNIYTGIVIKYILINARCQALVLSPRVAKVQSPIKHRNEPVFSVMLGAHVSCATSIDKCCVSQISGIFRPPSQFHYIHTPKFNEFFFKSAHFPPSVYLFQTEAKHSICKTKVVVCQYNSIFLVYATINILLWGKNPFMFHLTTITIWEILD